MSEENKKTEPGNKLEELLNGIEKISHEDAKAYSMSEMDLEKIKAGARAMKEQNKAGGLSRDRGGGEVGLVQGWWSCYWGTVV